MIQPTEIFHKSNKKLVTTQQGVRYLRHSVFVGEERVVIRYS